MRIEFDEECPRCGGTGLYIGMAERDGFAVVCQKCKGSGKHHFVYEYKEFTGRKDRDDVKTVLQVNPGICVGGNLNFGGIPYEQWKKDGVFPRGTEMREYVCPAWWCQAVGGTFDESNCPGFGIFSKCQYFGNKMWCWGRYDT